MNHTNTVLKFICTLSKNSRCFGNSKQIALADSSSLYPDCKRQMKSGRRINRTFMKSRIFWISMKDYGGIKNLDVIDIFYILFQLKTTIYRGQNILCSKEHNHWWKDRTFHLKMSKITPQQTLGATAKQTLQLCKIEAESFHFLLGLVWLQGKSCSCAKPSRNASFWFYIVYIPFDIIHLSYL